MYPTGMYVRTEYASLPSSDQGKDRSQVVCNSVHMCSALVAVPLSHLLIRGRYSAPYEVVTEGGRYFIHKYSALGTR